jgi:hypothetical protein
MSTVPRGRPEWWFLAASAALRLLLVRHIDPDQIAGAHKNISPPRTNLRSIKNLADPGQCPWGRLARSALPTPQNSRMGRASGEE